MSETPATTHPEAKLPGLMSKVFDWKEIILAVLVLVLIYQVLVPFVMIVWASFKTVHPGEPEFLSLVFSLNNYSRAFASEEFWEATHMTLYYGVACTVFSFLGGVFLAWVVTRTNTPAASFIGITKVMKASMIF